MRVAEVVGRVLAAHGVRHVFGVVGSGNFHVSNTLVAAGARFVAAAHEGGAASMADGFARTSGQVGVLSVHQGPGVTNALTGITEAAKSRTPLLVLAPEATSPRSNFHIDLPGAAAAFGADFRRVRAEHAAEDVSAAYRAAQRGATVLLGLPLDVQAAEVAPWRGPVAAPSCSPGTSPRPATPDGVPGVGALVAALRAARRPVFIAGRGARTAREALLRLADECGALLATSAAARGLFAGEPWNLDVSGGFATPLAAELIADADLVVAWGSTLNMWTTRHGRLIAPSAVVAQVDRDPAALGVHRPVDVPVVGDVGLVAGETHDRLRAGRAPQAPTRPGGAPPTHRASATPPDATLDRVPAGADRTSDRVAAGTDTTSDRIAAGTDTDRVATGTDRDRVATGTDTTADPVATDTDAAWATGGRRTPELRRRIVERGRWRDVSYPDESVAGPDGRIDPRTLSIALDDLLPAERTVVVDSGNFMGYPSTFLSVPDVAGFCFTQAFQSIGLGLASALGAAVARPDRLTVAALGDGGFLMSAVELVSAVRLGLPLLVVVYDDAAYGAEVHHFGPDGHPLELVRFPDTDLAAIARGYGCAALTVRTVDDLGPLREWLTGPMSRPLVVAAKVTSEHGSWWLEEAFRGH
ncbi:thiamine pyrophosphate-binding protein [Plantactinospora sp. CA-290183]|uniref:thiamine pyrophosphate-binding protein n=1 Tax=Plantactinospora sp. CA-290183 TaxID=3240006 RepID=UPI003D92FF61